MIELPVSNIRYLVIHHSATPVNFTVADIRREHLNNGWSDIGYHYVYSKETGKWERHVGRPMKYVGAHTIPDKSFFSSLSHANNNNSLGWCIVGRYDYRDPDPALINELAYGIKDWFAKYGKKANVEFSRNGIIPHGRVTATACPGKNTMKMLYPKLGL